jgi:hypothetical protein
MTVEKTGGKKLPARLHNLSSLADAVLSIAHIGDTTAPESNIDILLHLARADVYERSTTDKGLGGQSALSHLDK